MVEGEFQAESSVNLLLIPWFCCPEYRGKSAEGLDESFDLLLAERALGASGRFERRDLRGDDFSLALYFLGPGCDDGWIGSGFECGAVFAQFLVQLAKGASGGVRARGGVGLDLFEHGERVFEVIWVKDLGQPGVERFGDLVFSQVDRWWMVEVVGEGVFGGIAAAVVGAVVVPAPLHPPSAGLVEQQPRVAVGVLGTGNDASSGFRSTGGQA
ncbi:hypothetical protein [Nocardia carnea]|uniref:hypothetical protein n=1 Tax=Nocardia carnea TaxID=37328 RepID=UPI0024561179|nr:hypothetical protein [Nocardia carnea]